MCHKVIGEVVSLETDVLFVDEADIVIGEGDLLQMEVAEEKSRNDEEKADSPLLYKTHSNPNPPLPNSMQMAVRVLKVQKRDSTPSSGVELL